MAGQNKDSGDRTEKPTAKRLRDARKDGDVSKSRELTSTTLVLAWLLMVMMGLPLIRARLSGLFDTVIHGLDQPFDRALHDIGWATCAAFLWLTVPLLLGAAVARWYSEPLNARLRAKKPTLTPEPNKLY